MYLDLFIDYEAGNNTNLKDTIPTVLKAHSST